MSRKLPAAASGQPDNPYLIEWVRFGTGERLPLLVRRQTGLPIEAPTYWIVANERPSNKAPATLEKRLRHLMLLYLWADARGAAPEDFIRPATFFTLEQINDLDRFCRLSLAQAIHEASAVGTKVKVVPLRRLGGPVGSSNARADVASRLSAILSFLEYESFSQVARLEFGSALRNSYEQSRKILLDVLRERARSFHVRPSTLQVREGLTGEGRAALLAAIEAGSPGNPWRPQVQQRNELILRLMYELGLRRGEILCLRVSDVKLTPDGGFLTIVRRPQDPMDLRQPKPQVKTLGRELPLSNSLRQLFLSYVSERRETKEARKHPFLFVSSADGSPLSYWCLTTIFKILRKCDGIPGNITPHILRHDWNDRFSQMSDAAYPHRTAADAAKEERLRAYAMGWASTQTAVNYTKRWVRESSNQRLLEMQASKKYPSDGRKSSSEEGINGAD